MSESIQRPGYESRVNLHHDAELRAKVFLEGVAIFFFVRTGPVCDGDGFNAVRLFRVISEDSAERDSLDESSAFLIEGAHCGSSGQLCWCTKHSFAQTHTQHTILYLGVSCHAVSSLRLVISNDLGESIKESQCLQKVQAETQPTGKIDDSDLDQNHVDP